MITFSSSPIELREMNFHTLSSVTNALFITSLSQVESRIRQLEGGEITKISATAKQSAKFDKYESKSEVIEYKAAADVTLKRKAEDDDEEKPDWPCGRDETKATGERSLFNLA